MTRPDFAPSLYSTSNWSITSCAKSGPDIAAQWATGPVLTQVWGGAITPISDLIPKSETKNWLNTGENTYAGKIWAMPLYLIGIPWMVVGMAGYFLYRRRQGLVAIAGPSALAQTPPPAGFGEARQRSYSQPSGVTIVMWPSSPFAG